MPHFFSKKFFQPSLTLQFKRNKWKGKRTKAGVLLHPKEVPVGINFFELGQASVFKFSVDGTYNSLELTAFKVKTEKNEVYYTFVANHFKAISRLRPVTTIIASASKFINKTIVCTVIHTKTDTLLRDYYYFKGQITYFVLINPLLRRTQVGFIFFETEFDISLKFISSGSWYHIIF